jgi:hypothetical protein
MIPTNTIFVEIVSLKCLQKLDVVRVAVDGNLPCLDVEIARDQRVCCRPRGRRGRGRHRPNCWLQILIDHELYSIRKRLQDSSGTPRASYPRIGYVLTKWRRVMLSPEAQPRLGYSFGPPSEPVRSKIIGTLCKHNLEARPRSKHELAFRWEHRKESDAPCRARMNAIDQWHKLLGERTEKNVPLLEWRANDRATASICVHDVMACHVTCVFDLKKWRLCLLLGPTPLRPGLRCIGTTWWPQLATC